MTIKETDTLRQRLQNSCDLLIKKIGKIQIGSTELFPYGWRKAAKGRTVWRIVEEVITQNLEKYHTDFNLNSIHPSDSEITVYDHSCPEKFYHSVSCLGPSPSGTLVVRSV